MTNVDELVSRRSALQKDLSTWQSKAAVAKADSTRIKKELTESLKVLKDKFNCNTYEEAVKKRDSLLEEVSNKCDVLEEQLRALGSE